MCIRDSGGVVTDQAAAIAVGASILLLGILLHQGFARSRRDQSLVSALVTVEQAQHRIEEEVASSRDDINLLATATEKAIKQAPQEHYGDIVAEVRTLETLVRQISENPEGNAALPFKLAVDAVAAPTVSEDLEGEKLLDTIRDALDGNRVDVYLQPVVSLPQRKPSYYETYSRLRDVNGALLEPSKYIAVAESAELVTAIDNNLLFRCVQLVRKSQRRKLNFAFFCNISKYTLEDTSFFPEFIEFMQDNTELAENLIFEFGHADLLAQDRYITSNLGPVSYTHLTLPTICSV